MTDKPNSSVNFRKLLLNRCQKEFEKDKVDDVVFERRQKELDSTASVWRKLQVQAFPGLLDWSNISLMFRPLASDD